MSDLLDDRPRQTISIETKTGPTIKEWLFILYPKAKEEAEKLIRGRDNWEEEYCLCGRFSNATRNVPRTLRTIEEIYVGKKPFFRRSHEKHFNDFVDLLLPILCYRLLVGEIISAAGAEYYYRYEKNYE